MSNTNDYIITTMSGGITQRTFKTSYSLAKQADVEKATRAPFQISFPGVPTIRGSGKPYYAVPDGDPPPADAILETTPAPILADNLYHWWKFDDGVEGAGTTEAANSGVSSNADVLFNNGIGNVSLGNRNGKIDCVNFTGAQAASFTRAVAIDGDGNFTAMGAELYLADGSLDKFTVSMWAKVTSSLPSQFALLWGSSRNSNVDDGVGMYYDPSSPSAGLHFFCGSTNSSYQRVSSVAAPNVGEWFHVACVLDVTGGIHKAYLNASGGANFGGTVLPPQWGGSAEPIYFNAAALGATHASAPFHYFPVQISDFRWYNVALTDAQIQEIVEGDWP